MKPFVVVALLANACWSSGANAYWQRSHWAACNEAPSEAARVRLNCYIFAPTYYWPVERYEFDPAPGYSSRYLPGYQPGPRVRK